MSVMTFFVKVENIYAVYRDILAIFSYLFWLSVHCFHLELNNFQAEFCIVKTTNVNCY